MSHQHKSFITRRQAFVSAVLLLFACWLCLPARTGAQGESLAETGRNFYSQPFQAWAVFPDVNEATGEVEGRQTEAVRASYGNGWSRSVYQQVHNNRWQLFIANGTGNAPYLLHSTNRHEVNPRLSPDCSAVVTSKLAETEAERDTIIAIWLGEGGNEQKINPGYDKHANYPAWAANGSQVIYQAAWPGQSADVYLTSVNGGATVQLTTNTDYDGMPAFSPDGQTIAFISRRTGGYRIWLMNADGTNQRLLNTQPYSMYPTWSPDGKVIAFSADSDQNGFFEIWSINIDGTNEKKLYTPFTYADAFVSDWTPNGKNILFTSVNWLLYQGNWYWDNAIMSMMGAAGDNVVNISSSRTAWMIDLCSLDHTAPSTIVHPLPQISPFNIQFQYNTNDVGSPQSGIQSVECEFKENQGSWTSFNCIKPNAIITTGGSTYAFRARSTDWAGNVEPWTIPYDSITTIESIPPISTLRPSSRFVRGSSVLLSWSAFDVGGSSIKDYTLWRAVQPAGEWMKILENTTETTYKTTETSGQTIHYCLSARDFAFNAQKCPESGTIRLTFYDWSISGRVLDSSGAPVLGTDITIYTIGAITETTPLTPISTTVGTDGTYTIYTQKESGYQAQWDNPLYANLPRITYPGGGADLQQTVYLAPATNLVIDGTFEAREERTSPWVFSGSAGLSQELPHSGKQTAELRAAQSFDLTNAMSLPLPNIDYLSAYSKFGVDASGVAHLFGVTTTNNAYQWYHQSRADDGAWSTPVLIDTQNQVRTPALTISKGGDMAVAWIHSGHLTLVRRLAGGDWESSITSNFPTYLFTELQLGWSPTQELHLWGRCKKGSYPPNYVCFTSVAPAPAAFNNLKLFNLYANYNYSVFVGSDGLLYYFYESGDGRIYVREKRPLTDWQSPLHLYSQGHSGSISTFPTENPQGQAMLVFHAWPSTPNWRHEDVVFTRLGENTWEKLVFIDENVNYPNPITRPFWDAGGRLHLFVQLGSIYRDWIINDSELTLVNVIAAFPTYDAQNYTLKNDPAGNTFFLVSRKNSKDSNFPDGLYFAQYDAANQWSPLNYISASTTLPELVTSPLTGLYLFNPSDTGLNVLEPNRPSASETGTLSQVLTIPADMPNPVGAFAYRFWGFTGPAGNKLEAIVEDANGETVVFSAADNRLSWQHTWFDAAPWVGQSITLTIRHTQSAGKPGSYSYIDDISLGSVYPDTWAQFDPTCLRLPPAVAQTCTITYGNRGNAPAAAVAISLTLPEELVLVGRAAGESRTFVFDLGNLAAGQTGTLKIELYAELRGPLDPPLPISLSITTSDTELENTNNVVDYQVQVGWWLYLPLTMK